MRVQLISELENRNQVKFILCILNRSFLKTIYYLSYKNCFQDNCSRHWGIILSNMEMGDELKVSGLLFIYVLDQPLFAFGLIF